jgi:hypothetical protein
MDSEIIVALCALAGSALATFSGIIISNKMTNYRIEQLEIKVDKHSQLIERTYRLEGRMDKFEELYGQKLRDR